jgi:hypothetical protein
MSDDIIQISQDLYQALTTAFLKIGIPKKFVALELNNSRVTIYRKSGRYATSLIFHRAWTSGALWTAGASGHLNDYFTTRLPAISEPDAMAHILKWIKDSPE